MAYRENLTDGFTIARLLPFLEDFSDDVRWAVMDIIESLRQKGRVFDEAFLTMLSSTLGKSVTGEDASTRIASRAAELLFAFETPNAELSQARLRGDIDTSYFFDKKRLSASTQSIGHLRAILLDVIDAMIDLGGYGRDGSESLWPLHSGLNRIT